MAGEPSKNYLLILLDAYTKWEGRIKALGTLAGLLLFVIANIGAAVATALNSAASFLISLLTTLPLTLSVGMLTALVTRYQLRSGYEIAVAASLTFIGNSLITRWLGLGLHIDYGEMFASWGFADYTNPYHVMALLPVAAVWEYFKLYGVVGFALSTATGFITGRIIGRKR